MIPPSPPQLHPALVPILHTFPTRLLIPSIPLFIVSPSHRDLFLSLYSYRLEVNKFQWYFIYPMALNDYVLGTSILHFAEASTLYFAE